MPTGKKGKGKAENHEFLVVVVVVVTIVGRIGNGRYHTSFLDPATFSPLFHYLLALQQQVPRIPSSPTFQALWSTIQRGYRLGSWALLQWWCPVALDRWIRTLGCLNGSCFFTGYRFTSGFVSPPFLLLASLELERLFEY